LRPNDLVVNSGGVYFTDPGVNPLTGGGEAQLPDPRGLQNAVYYLPPGGQIIRIAEDSGRPNPIWRPNGIQLSPDEKILYVNDSYGEYILAFDIQPDGTVTNGRNFAKYARVGMLPSGIASSQSDGLVVDPEGRLYTCALGGVQVFSASGEYLGTVPISVRPQNLAFAGPDKKSLYVVGAGVAFKIDMLSQGLKTRAK
jgi:gluconolactonase